MAWETGTANGHRDLLLKLKSFSQANGWKVERWVYDPLGIADDELILSSNGESGQESIYVGIKTSYNVPGDRYNFKICASPLFSAGSPFESQPGACPVQYVYLWQNDMDYVICVDLDHIKMGSQVSGTTHDFYVGKLRTYCSLGHWPRQVVAFGDGSSESGRWSSQGNGYGSIQWLRSNPRAILWTNGQWITDTTLSSYPSQYPSVLTDGGGGNYENGDHWMIPLTCLSSEHGAMGEFIGCYYICGDRSSSGQTFESSDGQRRWIALQNIYRNGFRDFMAWELA